MKTLNDDGKVLPLFIGQIVAGEEGEHEGRKFIVVNMSGIEPFRYFGKWEIIDGMATSIHSWFEQPNGELATISDTWQNAAEQKVSTLRGKKRIYCDIPAGCQVRLVRKNPGGMKGVWAFKKIPVATQGAPS